MRTVADLFYERVIRAVCGMNVQLRPVALLGPTQYVSVRVMRAFH